MPYNLTGEIFRITLLQTKLFGYEWIIGLIITLIAIACVTRDIEKWKQLALPMYTGMHAVGVPTHALGFALAAVIFGIEAMSINTLGNILESTKDIINKVGGEYIHKSKDYRIKEQFEKQLSEKARTKKLWDRIGEKPKVPVQTSIQNTAIELTKTKNLEPKTIRIQRAQKREEDKIKKYWKEQAKKYEEEQ